MTVTIPDGRLVLDAAAWALACDLTDAVIPVDFATSWAGVPDAEQLQAGARARMTAAGMLDTAGDLHPLLRRVFAQLGQAPVRIRVRTAAGDRAVLAHLACDWTTSVALTRLQRVLPDPQAGDGRRVEDAAGIEVAAFATGDLGAQLWRLMPPALTGGPSTPGAPTQPHASAARPAVDLSWESITALLHLLRSTRGLAAGVAADAARQVLAELGLGDVPPAVASLAAPLAGAVEITTVLLPGTEHELRWQGLWLLTGDARMIAATPPPTPGGDGELVLRLADVDPAAVREDVVRSLAETFDTLATILTEATGGTR